MEGVPFVKIGAIIGIIGSILAWHYIFPNRLFPAILIIIFLMIFFSTKKKRKNLDSEYTEMWDSMGK